MESVMGTSQPLDYYQDCDHFIATVVRYAGSSANATQVNNEEGEE